jgi:hypothetical protein
MQCPTCQRDIDLHGPCRCYVQTTKCKHKWIDMEDGTLDRFCVRCSKKAKQAVMRQVMIEPAVPVTMPILREKMTVYTPVGMMEVDKEDLMKEFNKQLGIGLQRNMM